MEGEPTLKLSEIGQLSKQGAYHHQKDRLHEAIECYRKAYKLARELHDDKTERTCAFNLGAAYIAKGSSREGLLYLHKAIPPEDQRDERSNGDLYLNLGLGHEQLNKVDEKMQNEDRALEEFRRANDEYAKHDRDKAELQIFCLEKCFKIYQKRKDFLCLAEICQLMADVFSGSDESNLLKKAECLCRRATQLRLACKNDMAKETAKECKKALEDINGDGCIKAGKIFNDVGLLFTQLLAYDEARDSFKRAEKLVCNRNNEDQELEAVVLQNLGAAYNFTENYKDAINLHQRAADKYVLIENRNGQGQCFINLAFAYSKQRDLKNAGIAYHHALLASTNTNDSHMTWQALEGLGAVSFEQGETEDAVDYFIEALKNVGENEAAGDRIKYKMLHAVTTKGYRMKKRTYMFTHGPAEEYNHLSATPKYL